ncbi:hypothetical protein MTO96_051434, partial [Rhipicephalus appendiculatus]
MPHRPDAEQREASSSSSRFYTSFATPRGLLWHTPHRVLMALESTMSNAGPCDYLYEQVRTFKIPQFSPRRGQKQRKTTAGCLHSCSKMNKEGVATKNSNRVTTAVASGSVQQPPSRVSSAVYAIRALGRPGGLLWRAPRRVVPAYEASRKATLSQRRTVTSTYEPSHRLWVGTSGKRTDFEQRYTLQRNVLLSMANRVSSGGGKQLRATAAHASDLRSLQALPRQSSWRSTVASTSTSRMHCQLRVDFEQGNSLSPAKGFFALRDHTTECFVYVNYTCDDRHEQQPTLASTSVVSARSHGTAPTLSKAADSSDLGFPHGLLWHPPSCVSALSLGTGPTLSKEAHTSTRTTSYSPPLRSTVASTLVVPARSPVIGTTLSEVHRSGGPPTDRQ